MSETMNSAAGAGAAQTQDSAGTGEAVEQQSASRDYAGKLLMVMNGALVGVPSAYAVSHSLVVTAMAAALAGASAVVLLAAQRPPWPRRPPRRR
jgi:hypothetical protein